MTDDSGTRRPVLAVVTSTGEAVRFFDGLTYQPLGDLSVAAQPHEMAIDHAAGLLYVSHTYRSGVYTAPGEKAHEITVIDPFLRTVVDVVSLAPEEAPHGLALDTDRGVLYVTVEAGPAGGGALVALDTTTRKPVQRIEVGARGPHWVAVTPDGRKGYATSKADPFVSVLDLALGVLIGRIPAPYGTEEIAVSPDGRHAYAAGMALHYDAAKAGPAAPTLLVIDTSNDQVSGRIPLDGPACPVHVAADGRVLAGLALTDDEGDPAPGQLAVYSPGDTPSTFNHQFSEPVGQVPITIRTTPDGSRAFVANLRSGNVSVIDLASGATLRVLDIDSGDPFRTQGAHGIAYLPADACRPNKGDRPS
ncbi:YncE family protein [Wenjunlia tyrosinilytica]|uniref:Surface layer protein n=1 Tax=Wenjunlia tyrosinilytica TaxID=1544741 RepID=A0A917ZTW7_9ACTN|nr:YncE family protein [Wenjunlia tyrosinilytica]GGO93276.1 putative surface layer protein [Wenjunlia tyrosinilytica]